MSRNDDSDVDLVSDWLFLGHRDIILERALPNLCFGLFCFGFDKQTGDVNVDCHASAELGSYWPNACRT